MGEPGNPSLSWISFFGTCPLFPNQSYLSLETQGHLKYFKKNTKTCHSWNLNSNVHNFEHFAKDGAREIWTMRLNIYWTSWLWHQCFPESMKRFFVIWDHRNWETRKPWNQEPKKPNNFETFWFSMTRIPLPLNIPTLTPAPAPFLGDTRERGGHEWSTFSYFPELNYILSIDPRILEVHSHCLSKPMPEWLLHYFHFRK